MSLEKQRWKITWENIFGGDGQVDGIDCGDGFMDIYLIYKMLELQRLIM